MLLTFFQISLYFSDNFSSFIKKDVYLVLLKSHLYALIYGRNMHKGLLFFTSFWPIKYLKSFPPKDTLLDTTVLLISILYIKKGPLYW